MKKALLKKLKKMVLDNQVIIPCDKLCCVGVHKVQDCMTCKRLYFWRWIMNIVKNKINLNFWFGSVMHKGLERLTFEKNMDKVIRSMEKESKEASKKYTLDSKTKDEMYVQLEIAKILVLAYNKRFGKARRKAKILGLEVKFEIELSLCPVIFQGTMDGVEERGKKLVLDENKTAARIDNEYIQRLAFDKQINGYAMGCKENFRRYPAECDYIIIRKPSIRQRQTETIDQYLERFENDVDEREDFYFIRETIRFNKKKILSVKNDIEQEVFDLYTKYDGLDIGELLTPDFWPRNDRQCFNYGACDYLQLCRDPQKFMIYLRSYIMRDIRYDIEWEELSTELVYPRVMKGNYNEVRRTLKGNVKNRKI